MTASGPAVAVPLSPAVIDEDAAALVGRLDALRGEGAQRFDAVRFHFMATLAARLTTVAEPVRPVLAAKLRRALADFDGRFRQARQAADEAAAAVSSRQPALARELRRLLATGDFAAVHRLAAPPASRMPAAPLAALNRYIQQATQGGTDTGPSGDVLATAAAPVEMKSVRRFRETWSKIAADQQVDQALGRGPENAGPLNSHMLVLRSLALMRELSPDYLRRFLSQVDSLIWLDEESQKHAPAEVKPARRSRQKK